MAKITIAIADSLLEFEISDSSAKGIVTELLDVIAPSLEEKVRQFYANYSPSNTVAAVKAFRVAPQFAELREKGESMVSLNIAYRAARWAFHHEPLPESIAGK